MSQVAIDSVPGTSSRLCGIPLEKGSIPRITSGALGRRLSASFDFDDPNHGVQRKRPVSLQQAQSALQQLMGSGPEGARKPTIRDLLEMDPLVLSMMMTQLVLNISGNNASSICKQLERATEVQAELRNKQVAEYQEQISKAIEQADQVRKAGIMNAVFDWIIGGVEIVIGELKMAEGSLTADPLAFADGTAYLSAGIAGMVKAGAETALLLGADKDACNDTIKVVGTVQSACEGVALALDIMQIGRGISAARAVTKATEEVLESGVGKQLIDAVAKEAENELEVLAEKAGEEVSRVLGKHFGMPLEREMVEVGDMANEAKTYKLKVEANMVRSMGKSFTLAGIEELVKKTIESVGKDLLKKGEEMVAEKLRDTILCNLRKSIVNKIILGCTNQHLFIMRATVGGVSKISSSIIASRTADLQRTIEKLIVQQSFIDFMQNWMEDRKKTQQKSLKDAYQNGADVMRSASDIIDNCGTVLANIAGARA